MELATFQKPKYWSTRLVLHKQHLIFRKVPAALRYVLWLLLLRFGYLLYGRRKEHIPRSLTGDDSLLLSFTGSGLLFAYYHGVATYLRDHFNMEGVRLSAISGGTTTILALAMGLDLYQILLLGLHLKQWILKQGLYLNNVREIVDFIAKLMTSAGVTDRDVEELSARKTCYIGVTQCLPPQHRCVEVPSSLQELVELMVCSMSVVPFFRTPGVYKGKYHVDGGFSAVWSIPPGEPPSNIVRVTCFPSWATKCSPAMTTADIQPSQLHLPEIVLLYPWAHYQHLIKLGYQDTQKRHSHLVSRGLRPLVNAPLTPWSEWERLFSALDENNLPALSCQRSTKAVSHLEEAHDHILRTYSESNLGSLLEGPRSRRLSSSRSDAALVDSSRDSRCNPCDAKSMGRP